MRSIWKGHIRFSLVTIPVQIFNGLEDDGDLSFKQLHDKDNGKINYKKICSACNEEVAFGDIAKGYEYEPDRFVVFKKEELTNIKLKSTKIIDIDAFVDISEVHPSRFEALYFVGPNGEIANPTYHLLKEALLKSGKAGVGKVVIRDREDVVLLMPEKDGILMYKLRYPYEVRDIKEVPDVKETKVDDKQLELANTLINSMLKPFADVAFVDHYKDAVMEMVQQKVNGKQVVTVDSKEDAPPVVDIMDALRKSIEDAKKSKGA
jgi:DNA end-binding protein Ku